MATSNLYQYYQSIGKPLPSLNERKVLAEQFGIPNYAGTADQNAMLLNFLVKQTPVNSPSVNPILNPGVATDLSTIPVGVPTPPATNALAVPPPVPVPTFVTPAAPTYEDTLLTREEGLKKEITDLETRMANRTSDRNALLDTAGVFEDTRKLNELKAEAARLEDRKIEIPLEQRQVLRRVGGATTTEFQQMTQPELEKNLLSSLAVTRKSNALADTINTNIAIADNYLKAENDRQDLIYKQKQGELENVQSLYGNIMTEKQKIALEERKFANDIFLANLKNQSEIKGKYIDALIKAGVTGADLTRALNGSTEDVINALGNISPTPQQAILENTDSTISLIDKILNNEKGLEASVGIGLGNTLLGSYLEGIGIGGAGGAAVGSVIPGLGTILGGIGGAIVGGATTGLSATDDANLFRSQVKGLVSKETLAYLTTLKAQGGSLGALSEKELDALQNAVTGGLGLIPNKDGSLTGRSNLSEKDFKENLLNIQTAIMKVNIQAALGKEAYAKGNWRNASQQDVLNMYNELKASGAVNTGSGASSSPYQQDISGQPVSFNGKGNLPQRNNNPGNVKAGGIADDLAIGKDSQGHLIFPNPEAGFTALTRDVYAKITGNSRYLPANPTIAQLGKVYAEDPNWPISVSKLLGVTPSTATSTIPLEKLVAAIARQEGYFAT